MKHYESISDYNDMLYDSRPVTINEYLSDKYNIVHKELFNDALNKYVNEYVYKYINNDFLYKIFNILHIHNYDDDKSFEDIYNILVNLEIDNKSFLLNIKSIINKYINDIRTYLVENIRVKRLYDEIVFYKQNIKSFLYNDNNMTLYVFNINFDFEGLLIIEINNGYEYVEDNMYDNILVYMNNINHKLLNDVINEANKFYKKSHRIIEIKNSEYWMPSEAVIIHNGKPYSKNKIDLTPYWNNYQKMENYDISNLKLTEDNVLDSEVTYLDYIKGEANMYSKNTNINYSIPFKYLDENSKVSEEMQLVNTFGYMI